MAIQAINPATNEVLKTYEEMTPPTVKGIANDSVFGLDGGVSAVSVSPRR